MPPDLLEAHALVLEIAPTLARARAAPNWSTGLFRGLTASPLVLGVCEEGSCSLWLEEQTSRAGVSVSVSVRVRWSLSQRYGLGLPPSWNLLNGTACCDSRATFRRCLG